MTITLRRQLQFFAFSITAAILLATVCAYFFLTIHTTYPDEWDKVRPGMERDKANAILSPWSWQKENTGYMLERRSYLRLWRIDVFFIDDKVSEANIYYEDPHDTFLKEVGYVWSHF